MSEMLSEAVKETLEDAAKKLTGHRKRDFMAKVAQDTNEIYSCLYTN
jgi:hypothetical protein